MTTNNDPQIESMLDALGADIRAEPNAYFEQRVADGALVDVRRTSGRRRMVLGPAVLGGIAALVAISVFVLPTAPPPAQISSDAEAEAIAEMSFTLFDDAFGLDGSLAIAEDATSAMDPSSLDEWFVEGDAL